MTVDSLFLPGNVGSVQIKNRLFMPAMTTHLVANDGSVTEELLDYYEERAKGGVGLIVVETAHVEMEICITGSNLRIDDQKYVIGLSELTRVVHVHGAKIFLQMNVGQGSFCPPFSFIRRRERAPSTGPSPGVNPLWPDFGSPPRADDSRDREDHRGVRRSRKPVRKWPGLGGLELHGHGMYLLAQFMSPYTNKRKDKYRRARSLPPLRTDKGGQGKRRAGLSSQLQWRH